MRQYCLFAFAVTASLVECSRGRVWWACVSVFVCFKFSCGGCTFVAASLNVAAKFVACRPTHSGSFVRFESECVFRQFFAGGGLAGTNGFRM